MGPLLASQAGCSRRSGVTRSRLRSPTSSRERPTLL